MTNQEKHRLAQLIRRDYTRLKEFIRYRLEDRSDMDAEDIIQEVALNLYTRIDFEGPVENLAAYLYRSVRNKITDLQRRRAARKRTIQRETESERAHLEEPETLSPEEYESLYGMMYEALDELGPESREIIVATELEGYSFREISEETGIPVGTLLSRKHRAIATLQKIFREKHPDMWNKYYND